jgi:hypothetical protein
MVLPPLDDSLEDKIIILRAHATPMSMPTQTGNQRKAFWAQLVGELPAFLHWLTQWKIPADLEGQRFGVTHFHHPEVVDALSSLSPAAKLERLIDAVVFAYRSAPWEGTADELERQLAAGQHGNEVRRLCLFNNACGVYLGRLAQRKPARFQHRHTKTGNSWLIYPPTDPKGEGVKGCFPPILEKVEVSSMEPVRHEVGNTPSPLHRTCRFSLLSCCVR